jgi:hypothetical protein
LAAMRAALMLLLFIWMHDRATRSVLSNRGHG